tara:strand:+ start:157 stop:420 length:264 start_codon:yes stop_codon:yes gene_type:complete
MTQTITIVRENLSHSYVATPESSAGLRALLRRVTAVAQEIVPEIESMANLDLDYLDVLDMAHNMAKHNPGEDSALDSGLDPLETYNI